MEYALLLALIAVVSVAGITVVGEKASEELDCVAIEFEDPEVRPKVLEKLRDDVPGFSVVEAKYRDNCL